MNKEYMSKVRQIRSCMSKKMVSSDGSALLLVMVAMVVLVFIAISLTSVSMMNMSMKKSDQDVKKGTYYAEAGIDQVYAKTGDVVKEALTQARKSADDFVKETVDKIDEISKTTPPTSHSEYAAYSKYFNSALVPDDAEINKDANKEFKKAYRDYFNDLIGSNQLEGKIFGTLDEDFSTIGKLEVSRDTTTSINPFSSSNDKIVIKGITSTFTYTNGLIEESGATPSDGATTKSVTTDLVIYDADKYTGGVKNNYSTSMVKKKVTVKDNPIWQQAIVANGNVEVDGKLDARGNIYAMGTEGLGSNKPQTYGGVMAKGSGDIFVFMGDIVTRQYVQIRKGVGGKSKLVVRDGLFKGGNIYADKIITQEGSRGLIKSTGSMYTNDDLVLSGDGSHIDIIGSYYGYGDGTAKTRHRSSAIIINADTESDTDPAKLNIRGNSTDGDGGNRGALIMGLAEVDSETKYVKPESVSFTANEHMYKHTLWPVVKSLKGDSFLLENPYKLFGSRNSLWRFLDFINTHDYDYDYKTIVRRDGSSQKFIKCEDNADGMAKKKGFFLVYSDNQKDLEWCRKNWPTVKGETAYEKMITGVVSDSVKNVKIEKYIYTQGIRHNYRGIEDGYGGTNYFVLGVQGDPVNGQNYAVAQNLSDDISKDYVYNLHYLKKRKPCKIAQETVNGGQAPTVENANPIYKYTKVDTDNTIDYTKQENEILISLWSKDNSTLTICGEDCPQEFKKGRFIDVGSNEYQGIILNTGDIEIKGNVKFKGPLICTGDVKIGGRSSLEIINAKDNPTKQRISKIIANNDKVQEVFDVESYGLDPNVDKIHLEESSYDIVESGSTTFTKNNVDRNNSSQYSNYIEFEHWRADE